MKWTLLESLRSFCRGCACFGGHPLEKQKVLHRYTPQLEEGACDVGLLRAWRRLCLSRSLRSGDDGLVQHALEFLGEVAPPPLACTDADGARQGLIEVYGRLQGPRKYFALAVDGAGQPVLAGASAEQPLVVIWDLRQTPTSESPTVQMPVAEVLQGMVLPASCVCLDTQADIVAAGCRDGSVCIWALSAGVLLSSCYALVLESTRWTTVGHTQDVLAVSPAPCATDFESWHRRARDASCCSMDRFGTLCLWQDNGHCTMCVNALEEASRLNLKAGDAKCLSTAPNLIVCGLQAAVIGFDAQQGRAIFVLPMAATHTLGQGATLLALSVLSSDSLAGVVADGTILLWQGWHSCADAAEEASLGSAPHVLVGPCQRPCHAMAAASASKLCWLGFRGQHLEIRWVEISEGDARAMRADAIMKEQVPDHIAVLPA
eukprot:TRINITY_DN107408_c0_g1_i1.p1 TRINITY_DN107408_c0_g1~~TRINITY_DN107408_c0_g1_i1.p1  ORF type:complete len:452 (-),score=65.62 TRINITY_DN107408_c0_g1_i1:152-1447(-)